MLTTGQVARCELFGVSGSSGKPEAEREALYSGTKAQCMNKR